MHLNIVLNASVVECNCSFYDTSYKRRFDLRVTTYEI